MKLTRRKFWTEDSRGCEIEVEVMSVYEYENVRAKNNELVERLYRETHFGITAPTLDELKRKVGEI